MCVQEDKGAAAELSRTGDAPSPCQRVNRANGVKPAATRRA